MRNEKKMSHALNVKSEGLEMEKNDQEHYGRIKETRHGRAVQGQSYALENLFHMK